MAKRIACLVYNGFHLLDLAGPLSAFEICGYLGAPGYAIAYLAAQPGVVTSGGGARLVCDALTDCRPDDTLLVPGGFGGYDPAAVEPLLPLITRAIRSGQRVIAVGAGVRILARTGLLAGRKVVSHWAPAARLARDYPEVIVDAQHLYLKDGNIWTSAGVSAGTDVALAVVAEDHGSRRARETARALVLTAHRGSGGNQRSPLLDLPDRSHRFGDLVIWARERLDEPLPVERLAEQAALSVRHFTRAFTEVFGIGPAKAIEKLRVDAACVAIESGLSLDDAALVAGFGNTNRMRRSFQRILGTPPRARKQARPRDGWDG
ncbi:GlxA family transcriptional regulator [Novosphingobium bradum]|uniref:GlxA family transcriptional regulator n=1 Tax=Novosphingobium bradum TaxID=1737444 RepID=A0ABV7IS83_9SPHN